MTILSTKLILPVQYDEQNQTYRKVQSTKASSKKKQ